MSSSALLKPFLEQWDGPLPRGFMALAVAKGIALQQPFSLAPGTLQAIRQNVRHTSLAKALQARLTTHRTDAESLCNRGTLCFGAFLEWSALCKIIMQINSNI